MAGHSQFANIMHRKGKQDAKRSKLFSKLAREITVAAKLGLPDPNMNARLRAAILAARAENMPKDNIDRAIKKAAGADGENYDEIRYEGYGPGGVALIVEALTDNRNRTASDVRSYFTKAGGNLAETGAVSFMFDRVGVVEYDADKGSPDAMLEAALEAGADDVLNEHGESTVLCSPESFEAVQQGLIAAGLNAQHAGVVMRPNNRVEVPEEALEQLLDLLEKLDALDDVSEVSHNALLPSGTVE